MKFDRVKILVNVPHSHVEAVRLAAGDAGAGVLGEYSYCAFTHAGIGYFKGSGQSNPALGQRNQLQRVEEMKVEVVCPKDSARSVIFAMKQAHPYEEVPVEVLALFDPDQLP